MAIVKVVSNKGIEATINYEIYKEDNEIKVSGNQYKYENGMLNQSIKANLVNGKHRISFPVAFKTKCNGVFINNAPEDVKNKVSVTSFDNDGFEYYVQPHTHDVMDEIVFMATGF